MESKAEGRTWDGHENQWRKWEYVSPWLRINKQVIYIWYYMYPNKHFIESLSDSECEAKITPISYNSRDSGNISPQSQLRNSMAFRV